MADESEGNDTPVDEFRTIADMQKPDLRQLSMVVIAHPEGRTGPKTVYHQHEVVAQYPLSQSVPEEIRIQWDTARNLWLYAWHVWRFYPVAETKVYSTLELALRIRLERDGETRPLGLSRLMSEAIRRGMMRDELIEHHRRMEDVRAEYREMQERVALTRGLQPPASQPEVDPQGYCKALADAFPRLRNHYAHGGTSLNPSVELAFSIGRDLIEQLFAAPTVARP